VPTVWFVGVRRHSELAWHCCGFVKPSQVLSQLPDAVFHVQPSAAGRAAHVDCEVAALQRREQMRSFLLNWQWDCASHSACDVMPAHLSAHCRPIHSQPPVQFAS